MAWSTFYSYRKFGLGILGVGVLLALFASVYALGVLTLERHRGYFAPVWSPDGRHVYLIQRDTVGIVWGVGWEFFTPPARSYVISDRISLRRLDSVGGKLELLASVDDSPVEGRVTKHYRGRIFNTMSARIQPSDRSVEFTVKLNIPRVPSSELWSLKGSWSPDVPLRAQWSSEWAGNMATPEEVLLNGVELMTVRGNEFYPAAILAVESDGTHRVLLKNNEFDDLYLTGVPPRQIAERSNRERLEHRREVRRVRAELTAKYLEAGLHKGEPWSRAHEEMENRGYLPKSPRLTAKRITEPSSGIRVFDIPQEYFRVGLFQDIAEAIARPGEEVKTGTGTYLKYYDDETGLQLKAWREAGNDKFMVRTGGQLYLLQVHHFRR